MGSRRNRDFLSALEDVLLVMIISCLPFKEAVRTSVLSRRWSNLYLQSSNIAFKETEFMKPSVFNDREARRNARVSFVQLMGTWITRFSGEFIHTLEVCLANPVGFEVEIRAVIDFAVPRGVKNLVLDFSDHSWRSCNQAAAELGSVFQLPECVYNSTNLVSFKLFFCTFNATRFVNQSSLKSLCFGWIPLGNILALLENSPLLESLSIQNCWNIGLQMVIGYNNRLRELIFKNCIFSEAYSTLDVPSIQIFKYSGTFHYFEFMSMNKNVKEAELDFEPKRKNNKMTGSLLATMLYIHLAAKKLTVSPYVLQLIHEIEEPVKLQTPMETKHLVMKTSMQTSEFVGISQMIKSCEELETLTFALVPPSSVYPEPLHRNLDYWTKPFRHPCMEKTLTLVEVQDYRGTVYETYVLQALVQYCSVLQRLDLYVANGLLPSEREVARTSANMLGRHCERGSDRLKIFIFE